jgi:hypothetical protein
MPGLEGTMAGFAGYTRVGVAAIQRLVAGGMTFQAHPFGAFFYPIALEDWRRKRLGVAGGLPGGKDFFVAALAGFRTGVCLASLPGWRRGRCCRGRLCQAKTCSNQQAYAKTYTKYQPAAVTISQSTIIHKLISINYNSLQRRLWL